MKYTVGQVIFLLLKKDKRVLPVKIVEQIVRRTLDEEAVSYNVIFPDKKGTVAALEDLSAEVFTDARSLRNKMIERATSMIDEIVDQSTLVASEKFDYEITQKPPQLEDIVVQPSLPTEIEKEQLPESFSNAEVDLGGGLKARVSSSVI
jgi:hypothetical protein